MKRFTSCVIALAMSVSAFSQTSVPAVPTLTAGAEFKGLRFDWDPVPGATWYQLEYRAHENDDFIQQGDDLPATATSTHFSFPVHLFDWSYARYRLAACNSAGCSRSSSVIVAPLRRDAVGYFKAAAPRQNGGFGATLDLSPDGYNLVASAPGEVTQTASGPVGGGVYVFRRGSDGRWTQRARLDANGHGRADAPDIGVYLSVAVSGSGNTVAVGSQDELGTSGRSGQVDVFHLKDGTWTRTRIPRPDVQFFGDVRLSESGYVLATNASTSGTDVSIYKSINGTWTPIFKTNYGLTSTYCGEWQLSRDGRTLALLCSDSEDNGLPRPVTIRSYLRVLSGSNFSTQTDIPFDLEHNRYDVALDETASTIAVSFDREEPGEPTSEGFVRIFKRNGGGYQQVAQLDPGAWRPASRRVTYGANLAMSGDGHTLIVGDFYDNGSGVGPLSPPLAAGTDESGAAYVYRLTDAWKLVKVLKPNYYNASQVGAFGRAIRVSRTGKTVTIGVSSEDSSASGIDGDWANSGRSNSGAVFMY